MSRALKFGKSVADNGWGMFTTYLTYKLEEQGKKLINVDKWFPSTQTCSCCGNKKEMPMSVRTYECSCGSIMERDHNAAINIKNRSHTPIGVRIERYTYITFLNKGVSSVNLGS